MRLSHSFRFFAPSRRVFGLASKTSGAQAHETISAEPVSSDINGRIPAIGAYNEVLSQYQTEAKCCLLLVSQRSDDYNDNMAQHHDEILHYANGIQTCVDAECFLYRQTDDIKYVLLNLHSQKNVQKFLEIFCREQRDLPFATRFLPVHHNRNQFNWLRKRGISNPRGTSLTLVKSRVVAAELMPDLMNAKSISVQCHVVMSHVQCRKPDTILKFFIASLLEECIAKLNPSFLNNIKCYPFGSSTNGFSKTGSDIDMELDLINWPDKHIYENSPGAAEQRLKIFVNIGKLMERNSKLLQKHFGFRYLLTVARYVGVPIIELFHEGTGLYCDLAFHRNPDTNRSGSHMSELLWIHSQLQPCVRPLVFTVWYWAATAKITTAKSGPYVKDFHLLIFVLHFLVAHKRCLPIASDLLEHYNIGHSPTNVGIHQRDSPLERLTCWSQDTNDKLGDFLLEFFDYYSKFQFEEHAISLHTATITQKLPQKSCPSIFMLNPLDLQHNMASFVEVQEACFLRQSMSRAHRVLKDAPHQPLDGGANWGLMCLLNPELYTSTPLHRKRSVKLSPINVNPCL